MVSAILAEFLLRNEFPAPGRQTTLAVTPRSFEVLATGLEFRFWTYKIYSLNTYVLQESNFKNYKYFHGKGRKITTFLFWPREIRPLHSHPTLPQDIHLLPFPSAPLKISCKFEAEKIYVKLL